MAGPKGANINALQKDKGVSILLEDSTGVAHVYGSGSGLQSTLEYLATLSGKDFKVSATVCSPTRVYSAGQA